MNFNKFWKESTLGFILKNLLLAIVLSFVLGGLTLFLISKYTHHGETEVIPNLKGLYSEEAEVLLKNHGLYLEIIDSVYDIKQSPGIIIEQIPSINSIIKRNRPVFVIINARQVRQIPLPDINDVSYRQATAMLNSVGLQAGNIEYSPSEYQDLVISVKYKGLPIAAGTRLPEGSSIVLVVGSGAGGENSFAPSLIGLALEEGRNTALSGSMIVGAINYDIPPDGNENDYIIYSQRPRAGHPAYVGGRIDVWLSRDRTKLDTDRPDNDDDDVEEFF